MTRLVLLLLWIDATAAFAQDASSGGGGTRHSRADKLGEDWPRWRGPRGDGTWRGPKLPAKWPKGGLPRIWRQQIGGGYGGVAATGGRVYVMDLKKIPQPKRKAGKPPSAKSPGNKQIKDESPDGTERVLCFDAAGGKLLWSHMYTVRYGDLSYGNGPRSTPTVFDGRVYTLGAVGRLHCFNAATGEILWDKDLVREAGARVSMWGLSASPVVFEDLIIVHPGAQPDGGYIALDRRSGKERWRSLTDAAGYATPILIKHHDQMQLVCWTPSHVRGLNPRNGKLLWTIPYEVTYGTAIATPIYQEGIVFVSGYWEGAKAIRLADPSSDKTPRASQVIWSDKRNLRGLMSQPLYKNGYAYLLDKRHGLTCFELKTGRKHWDDDNRMTPKGRNPQATMVWLGEEDRTIMLNSQGDLILARINKKGYHEQSRTNVIGPTWAHPAYSGARVYARNDEELVCVELPLR